MIALFLAGALLCFAASSAAAAGGQDRPGRAERSASLQPAAVPGPASAPWHVSTAVLEVTAGVQPIVTASALAPTASVSALPVSPTASPVPVSPTASPVPVSPAASPVPASPTASAMPAAPTASPRPASPIASAKPASPTPTAAAAGSAGPSPPDPDQRAPAGYLAGPPQDLAGPQPQGRPDGVGPAARRPGRPAPAEPAGAARSAATIPWTDGRLLRLPAVVSGGLLPAALTAGPGVSSLAWAVVLALVLGAVARARGAARSSGPD